MKILFLILALAGNLRASKILQWNFENSPASAICGGTALTEVNSPTYSTTPVPIPNLLYCVGPLISQTAGPYHKMAASSLTAFSNLSSFTIEGFVYVTALAAASNNIVLSYDGPGISYFTFNTVGNVTRWATNVGQGSQDVLDYSFLPTVNTWYFYALTWDGTTKRIYFSTAASINNTVRASSAPSTASTTTVSNFYISNYYPSTTLGMLGYYDRISIDNTALSSFPSANPAPCASSTQSRGMKLRNIMRLKP